MNVDVLSGKQKGVYMCVCVSVHVCALCVCHSYLMRAGWSNQLSVPLISIFSELIL